MCLGANFYEVAYRCCSQGHSELIFYNEISTPFAVRDMVVHVYAADCTEEHGCLAFMGQSVKEFRDVQVPPEPSLFQGYRAHISYLSGVVNIISPSLAKVSSRSIDM